MDEQARILVADADPGTAGTLAGMIEPAWTTRVVHSGAEALDVATAFKPSIIILDADMPDQKGYDVCAHLRRLFMYEPLQIVLMSASVGSDRLSRSIAVGADDFLTKPVEPLEFGLRLKAAWMRLSAQRKLMAEREFYRQAVKQEEYLTARLLDRQMGLRETLADLESKRADLEQENTRLAAQARYDALTGLLNRHSLNARLELEMKRASSHGQLLAGLMVDIDKFKSINDSYGHIAGDEVLRTTGEVLKRCLRKVDYAGRYGGEEFFVLLPEATMEAAAAIAERIRSSVEATRINTAGVAIGVTVSVGIGIWRPEDTVIDWVGRADQAMYRAKQLGRNRVES